MRKVFFGFFALLLTLVVIYLGIFGRALHQNDDHLGIFLALPRVFLGEGVAKVNNTTYLASDRNAFREEMERQGFIFVDQMGSGYFFEKEGKSYLSTSWMYSSHFMVFSVPREKML